MDAGPVPQELVLLVDAFAPDDPNFLLILRVIQEEWWRRQSVARQIYIILFLLWSIHPLILLRPKKLQRVPQGIRKIQVHLQCPKMMEHK